MTMIDDNEHITPIEEIKPGEAVDLCERLGAALRIARGHDFQDRDAWEKLARALAKRFDTFAPTKRDMENAMSNNSVAIIVRSIEGRGIQIEVSVLGGVVNLEVKHIPLAPGDQYVDPPFRMTIGGPVGQPGVRDFDEACPMRAAPLEHRLEVKEPRVCAKIMPDVMREYGVSDRLGGDRYWCGRARGHDGSCGDWVYGSQPKHFEAML